MMSCPQVTLTRHRHGWSGRSFVNRRLRPDRLLAALLTFVMTGVLTVVCGCQSNQPSVSGFALGDTRIVSVGDLVELRAPIREDGSRAWRVTSYDSFYLTLTRRPTLVEVAPGRFEIVAVARARVPGETQIVMTEQNVQGRRPRTLTYRINILE
jgi:hypothetical protein